MATSSTHDSSQLLMSWPGGLNGALPPEVPAAADDGQIKPKPLKSSGKSKLKKPVQKSTLTGIWKIPDRKSEDLEEAAESTETLGELSHIKDSIPAEPKTEPSEQPHLPFFTAPERPNSAAPRPVAPPHSFPVVLRLARRSASAPISLPKQSLMVSLKLPVKSPLPDNQVKAPINTTASPLVHSFFSRKSAESTNASPPVPPADVGVPKPVHSFFSRPKAPIPDQTPPIASVEPPKPAATPFLAPVTRPTPRYRHTGWYPAWPKFPHVHGDNLMPEHTTLFPTRKKQKSSKQQAAIPSHLNVVEVSRRFNAASRPTLTRPERQLLAPLDIYHISPNLVQPSHESPLRYILDQIALPSSFDKITCEQQMWTAKYAPPTSINVVTAHRNSTNVLNWLQRRLESLKKMPAGPAIPKKRKKREELDDFIVSDDVDLEVVGSHTVDAPSDFLVLYGPPGCGKSASVYAAASELGVYVFEINSSQRRSGRDVMSLLEGMSQSHLVHAGDHPNSRGQDSVVLLEDVDVLYEEENSFWSGLEKFVAISRRPIIMTCADPSLLPATITDGRSRTFLEFGPAPLPLQVDALCAMALSEGHLVERESVADLVTANGFDFRKSVNSLQFWCQMGIGGRRSGIDWFLTRDEQLQLQLSDSTRVISRGTPVITLEDEEQDCFYKVKSPGDREIGLSEYGDAYDMLSSADIMFSHSHSSFREQRLSTTSDRMIGIAVPSELCLQQDSLPFELKVYPALATSSRMSAALLPSAPPSTVVDAVTLTDSVSFLGYPRSAWGDILSTTGCSAFEQMPLGQLSVEVLPYVRDMAREDVRAEQEFYAQQEAVKETELAGRVSRRSYAAMGLKPCKRYLDGDLEEVLRTFPTSF